MRKAAINIWRSFPVQLFILHLKRNHFLAFSWLFIGCIITGAFGARYGIPLLFLDPEYLNAVNFSSFCIVGAAFGGFLIIWNVTSYVLNAYHFSFLATLSRPFGIYCLNNSIFPVAFSLLYIYRIISFQSQEGLSNLGEVGAAIAGLLTGMVTILLIAMIYFFRTNKDIFQIMGIIRKREEKEFGKELHEPTHEQVVGRESIQIEYYISHNLQLRHARHADHYPESAIRSVYKQHHINAFFIELSSIILITTFGLLMDSPFFRIPAAASIFLLIAILIILIGAFYYWLGHWKIVSLLLIIFIINIAMQYHLFSYENKVYGLNYDNPVPYNLASVKSLSDSAITGPDSRNTIAMLNNWKNKFDTSAVKPKIIFINCSGGGLRAMSFVMQIFQNADSITHHQLMEQCPLITGASGGMVAAAYYREIYLRKLQGENIDLTDQQYVNNISADLLNAVSFTIVVNDLFYPWQKFSYQGESYRKDRGYMFEKILNENTGSVFDKTLGDYKKAEFNMQIPMMLFTPTIINDERKLFIATQPVSYLSQPLQRKDFIIKPESSGVDIHQLLRNNSTDNISFASVLRMNCTFPYILPVVHLPTNPSAEVMDAGIRDNYGLQTATQFIAYFKDWMLENTSGVIIVNIRAIEQELKTTYRPAPNVLSKFAGPIDNLYTNWVEIQDYQNDQLIDNLNTILDGHLQVVTFEYQPSEKNKRASLSFHLTAKEKQDIGNAANNAANKEAYFQLEDMLR